MFIQALDYDDISGVYLGPRTTFDDEDLQYLCKELDEGFKESEGVKQERPQSPLIVDSISGRNNVGIDMELRNNFRNLPWV